MTSRRTFLAGAVALAAAPLAAQDRRQYRIGMLETVPIAANNANLAELHKGMQDLGHEEGKTYIVLYRSAEGRTERFPALASELARQKVDVFLTRGTPATLAARDTESGIPVVASAIADAIDGVTGLTSNVAEIGAKRLDLLRAVAPGVKRIGSIVNPDNPASLATWKVLEGAAQGLNLKADMIDVRKPEELSASLDTAVKAGVDGFVFGIETLTQSYQTLLIEFAAKNRTPAVYAARHFVEAGGLMSYGVLYSNLYYRSASYIDKVLKGAKPADLAIEKPNKFELVINRKTAFTQKVAIPPDLFLRSDDVIE